MAALIIAVLLAGEIVVYAVLPRTTTALEHFTLFQKNWLAGLLTLDLLGMISYVLFIPLILAFHVALRRTDAPLIVFATVLFFVGIADFFATNTAFPILSLSHQYAAAATDFERAMYLAAGQAMLTIFNENAFLVSYVIVSAAWTMILALCSGADIFGRFTAGPASWQADPELQPFSWSMLLPATVINIAICSLLCRHRLLAFMGYPHWPAPAPVEPPACITPSRLEIAAPRSCGMPSRSFFSIMNLRKFTLSS